MSTLTRLAHVYCSEPKCMNTATAQLHGADGRLIGLYCDTHGAERKANTDAFEAREAVPV